MKSDKNGRLIFVAQRDDGIGARLDALVDAIALAEYYNAEFRFSWIEIQVPGGWHAVKTSAQVFSQDFIDRYWVEAAQSTDMIPIDDFLKKPDYFIQKSMETGELLVELSWFIPEWWLKAAGPDFLSQVRPESWRKIAFADHLMEILDYADGLDIPPNTVGVHLRAGDVLYGNERFNHGAFTKIIPYQLASHFLNKCQKNGRTAILLGQDAGLCKALADAHQVLWVEDLVPTESWSHLERELFDIALLSRCNEIVGGTSAFLLAAASRGGKKVHEISEIYDFTSQKNIILADAAPDSVKQVASNMQKAASLYSIVRNIVGQKEFDPAEALSIINEASNFDPENGLYIIIRASLMMRQGDIEGAETLISTAALSPVDTALRQPEQWSYRQFPGAQWHVEGSVLGVLTHLWHPARPFFRNLLFVTNKPTPWSSACIVLALGVSSSRELKMARNALESGSELPPEWKLYIFEALEEGYARAIGKKPGHKAAAKNLVKLRAELETANRRHERFTSSLSWKVTKPLRWLVKRFKPKAR